MKKFLSGILALFLCVPIVSPIAEPFQVLAVSEAEEKNTVTIDGLIYELDGGAYLIGIEDVNATSITIPSTVNGYEVLMSFADYEWFANYPNLEEINTENTPGDSFFSIDGVLFFNISGDTQALAAYPRGREGAYSIPEGTVIVMSESFMSATKLTSVSIPESLKQVEGNAFFGCTALEEVNGAVPTTYGDIFRGCTSLKAIEFAEPVDSYGSQLLNFFLVDNPALETLIIPEKRNLIIQASDIIRCPSLKTLKLPAITGAHLHIEECDSLETLEFSGHVSSDVTISECPDLKSIIVRDVIMGLTISDCPELTTMYCLYGSYCGLKSPQNVDKLTVYGEQNSDTQERCERFDIPFVPLELATGDVNGDTKIDVLDVITINRVALGKEILTDAQNQAADVNRNGIVDAVDSLLILKYIVGLMESFDVQ